MLAFQIQLVARGFVLPFFFFFVQTPFQQKTVFVLTNMIIKHNIKYAAGFDLNPSFFSPLQKLIDLTEAKPAHTLGLQFLLWYYGQKFL